MMSMIALPCNSRLRSTPRLLVLLFLTVFITYLMKVSHEPRTFKAYHDEAPSVHIGPLTSEYISSQTQQVYNLEELQDLVNDNQFYLTPSWRQYLSRELAIPDPLFQPSLNIKEKQILYDTLLLIQDTCESLNFTCMMYGGTLLGSWRHHDIIPWDGDADVLVNATYKDELYSALSMYIPAYEVIQSYGIFKVFSKKAKKTSKYPWKWPYVDIWFFQENDTHVWDEITNRAFKREYVYPKSVVFPTHFRPFGKILLQAPRDTFRFLQITYKTTDCETYFYNHKLEQTESGRFKTVSCRNLQNNIGFVHRFQHRNHIVEIMFKGTEKLHALLVNEPFYAISDPYNLTLL